MGSSSPRTASSRPRAAIAAAAGTAIAVALAGAGAIGSARGPQAPPAAWMLEVHTDSPARADPGRAPRGTGVSLALNAMTDDQRADAAGVLARLADRLERERNPLVEDLDDDDARADAEGLLGERLPMLTAAAALAPGRWTSQDGRIVVRATTECAEHARCIPLGPPRASGASPDDRVAARARFLAWPLAYAVVLRAPPGRAPDLVAALRAPGPGSRIALVLGDADLHGLRFSKALPALAESAARLDRLGPPDMPMKQLFARVSGAGSDAAPDDLRWLALPADAVLVVPRLGALATIAAFVAEVRGRVATAALRGPVEWLAWRDSP